MRVRIGLGLFLLTGLVGTTGCKGKSKLGKEGRSHARAAKRHEFSCEAFAKRVRTCGKEIRAATQRLMENKVLEMKDKLLPEQYDREMEQARRDARLLAGVLVLSHSGPAFVANCQRRPAPADLPKWRECFRKETCSEFAECLVAAGGAPRP